jgi:hypothetical protein
MEVGGRKGRENRGTKVKGTRWYGWNEDKWNIKRYGEYDKR